MKDNRDLRKVGKGNENGFEGGRIEGQSRRVKRKEDGGEGRGEVRGGERECEKGRTHRREVEQRKCRKKSEVSQRDHHTTYDTLLYNAIDYVINTRTCSHKLWRH